MMQVCLLPIIPKCSQIYPRILQSTNNYHSKKVRSLCLPPSPLISAIQKVMMLFREDRRFKLLSYFP